MEEEGDSQKSIWNFDGAELFLLFDIKRKIVYALESWDLEEAYRKVRLLRMELDAKLKRENKKVIEEFQNEVDAKKNIIRDKRTEKKIVDDMMTDLDNSFTEYNEDKENKILKESLFKKIEEFYMYICYLMKSHGLYFREGEDMRLAVLRR